jgi:hypothetical protein
VTIYKLRVNNIHNGLIEDADTIGTYICHDTLIPKDSIGFFVTEKVPAYYFETNETFEQELEDIYLGLEIITAKKRITSYTKIVGISHFHKPNPNSSNYVIQFDEPDIDIQVGYPLYSQYIGLILNCTYFEVMGNGERVSRSFSIVAASETLDMPVMQVGVSNNFEIDSESFYQGLLSDLRTNGDTINTAYRTLGKVCFMLYSGNSDLAMALRSNMATGFSTEPMNYSNVFNGLGTFSSLRVIKTEEYDYSYKTRQIVKERFGFKYGFILGGK